MADVIYRVAGATERPAVAELWRRVENDADFMLAEPGERAVPIEDRSFEIVVGGDPLLGALRVAVGRFQRVAHCGHLVLGVLSSRRGQGIGTGLLHTLIEDEAPKRGLTRLQLNVAVENPAHRLYQRMGFTIEGIRKHAVMVDGIPRDEYAMALLL
ncbi:N-acetyltransferase family protein [Spirillospora sp. CA-128828]|uniref:GNAT family N-acetyltransferase n=1 Tax=Spirillospora sp. CA-128828 TaxID=3240033 RepID=UPI003D8B9F6E